MTTLLKAYFAANNHANDIAEKALNIRKLQLDFWHELLPSLDSDFDLLCENLALLTGLTSQRVGKIFMALYRLQEMPILSSLQQVHCPLDLDRIVAIDECLAKLGSIPPDILEFVDQQISNFLTPTKPSQALPTTAQLKRRVRDIAKSVDDSIAFRDPRKTPRYSMDHFNGMSVISLTLEPRTAAAVDAWVRETAAKLEVPLIDAATALLTGSTTPAPRVVLHAYQATDVAGAPTYVQGYGWLTEQIAPTLIREFPTEFSPAQGYQTPEVMAKYIEGRDGTCRMPSCNKSAFRCQKDHRINYSEGGATHPDNLVSLCQHHHNMKTDGRVFYVIDPQTDDIYWLFEDGTWSVSEASGPLSHKAKRWVQTFSQAMTAYQERSHHDAQVLKMKITVPDVVKNDEHSDPPPF